MIPILFLFLICAVAYDIAARKIPNTLTFSAMVVGLVLHGISGSVAQSSLGLLLAFGIGLLAWTSRAIGGGDHKMIMVVGAFLGIPLVMRAFMLIAIAGGIHAFISLIIAYAKQSPRIPWKQLLRTHTTPYSIPIAVGTVITVLVNHGI